MSIYSVINIDIIGSRDLINRKDIQNGLKEYIDKINYENRDLFLAPITFTLGDEWQIILKRPFESYNIIEKFQRFLKGYGVDIYVGVGIGDISTDIYADTRLMDGECFIRAREAIEIVKNKNRFYNKNLSSKENNIYFCGQRILIGKTSTWIGSMNEVAASTHEEDYHNDINTHNDTYINGLDINTIINTIIENTEVLKSKITEKQMEIIKLYEKEGSYNNMVKKNPQISKSSISQKLNDSNYFLIENNKAIIKMLLKLYCEIREGNAHES